MEERKQQLGTFKRERTWSEQKRVTAERKIYE